MPKEIPPLLEGLLEGLKTTGRQIARASIEGAAEAVLDEVQGRLRAVDSHIAGARGKAAAKRREREKGGARDPEIEVVVVESPKRKKRA